jgi:hypothetical protein
VYFGECKVGHDERFDLDIHSEGFQDLVEDLVDDELLDNDEYEFIKELYMRKTEDADMELKESLRLLYVLRWTRDELIAGKKTLRGGKSLSLIDAIKQLTKIKVEITATINGRYIEVSNFFYLVLYNKDEDTFRVLNVDTDQLQSTYIRQMKNEVIKLATPVFENVFKMAKRVWLIGRATKNEKLLSDLTPLFQGNIARVSQITSDISTLLGILKTISPPPHATIIEQIDNLKPRLAYANDVGIDFDIVYEAIDKIVSTHRRSKRFTDQEKQRVIEVLTMVYEYLKGIVKTESIKYLTSKGLYPTPQWILNIPDGTGTEQEYVRTWFDKTIGKTRVKPPQKSLFVQHADLFKPVPRTVGLRSVGLRYEDILGMIDDLPTEDVVQLLREIEPVIEPPTLDLRRQHVGESYEDILGLINELPLSDVIQLLREIEPVAEPPLFDNIEHAMETDHLVQAMNELSQTPPPEDVADIEEISRAHKVRQMEERKLDNSSKLVIPPNPGPSSWGAKNPFSVKKPRIFRRRDGGVSVEYDSDDDLEGEGVINLYCGNPPSESPGTSLPGRKRGQSQNGDVPVDTPSEPKIRRERALPPPELNPLVASVIKRLNEAVSLLPPDIGNQLMYKTGDEKGQAGAITLEVRLRSALRELKRLGIELPPPEPIPIAPPPPSGSGLSRREMHALVQHMRRHITRGNTLGVAKTMRKLM